MIFLDIGAHRGQTLEEVVKDRWGFTEIHAVEPMPREVERLRHRFGSDPRVRIHPFALMDYTGQVTMYGTNDELEASVYSGKDDVDPDIRTVVPCVATPEFFRTLPDDALYVDMNCEGAEVPILDSLISSGEIHRITHVRVSFDIGRVRDFSTEADRLRAAMRDVGFTRYTDADEYAYPSTHQEGIAAWLWDVGVRPAKARL